MPDVRLLAPLLLLPLLLVSDSSLPSISGMSGCQPALLGGRTRLSSELLLGWIERRKRAAIGSSDDDGAELV